MEISVGLGMSQGNTGLGIALIARSIVSLAITIDSWPACIGMFSKAAHGFPEDKAMDAIRSLF